jgi:molybdenum cofactor synthesis domain-containing protein
MAKTAGIILIGNEILSGKIVDANASYLCRELRELGVDVRKISVIPDEVDLIASEVGAFSRGFDVVFTSGGVGPTHDDVTIEGVARALGVPVVRDARLVRMLEGFYRDRRQELNEARLKMAEVPDGAELMAAETLAFPAVVIRNIYVLPGVPEIFRQKFDALKERFRESPFHLCSVFVNVAESTLADHLNELLRRHPELMLGSYPEFLNPEYKVKVTLESKDRDYVARAVDDFLGRLPAGVVVRVEGSARATAAAGREEERPPRLAQ